MNDEKKPTMDLDGKELASDLQIVHDALVDCGWKFYQRGDNWYCMALLGGIHESESPQGYDNVNKIVLMASLFALAVSKIDKPFCLKFLEGLKKYENLRDKDARDLGAEVAAELALAASPEFTDLMAKMKRAA